MFNDKQTQVLAYELDSSRIKSRSKGNVNLSYLEGFDVIETANKIFGYGNWNYTISTLEQVSQELNHNQNNIICYKAVINITVHDTQHSKSVTRTDVGFGSGIAKTLADAHEGGAKEAVTDAIKRTLRSFGNQFGNSLYNKSKNNQSQNSYQQQSSHTPNNQQNYQMQNNSQNHSALTNLGLAVVQQGQNLIVVGETVFENKETIKQNGFRWDGANKQWYKPLEQQQAA